MRKKIFALLKIYYSQIADTSCDIYSLQCMQFDACLNYCYHPVNCYLSNNILLDVYSSMCENVCVLIW